MARARHTPRAAGGGGMMDVSSSPGNGRDPKMSMRSACASLVVSVGDAWS
jgi:hypothetical protein